MSRPPLGRRVLGGWALGPRMRLTTGQSLLVVGPTQSGKTASLVVPALLSWRGPAVVASVKADVLDQTGPWRRSLGRVRVLEPGRDGGLTWDLLEGATSLRRALRVAKDLAPPGRGDADFWNSLAAKLVGASMVLAREGGRSATEVARLVEARDLEGLADCGTHPEARAILEGFTRYEPRTLDGVVTTAETMLLPWRLAQPATAVADLIEGPHTLYLCSPRAEQAAYRSLTRAALRCLLEAQQARAESGRALDLLLVLDEAASVAPLEDLDELAATLVGLGVTLLTVVQDLSQLRARYGERAATVVNNHAARLLFSGLSDPALRSLAPEVAEAPGAPLRQRPPGRALILTGRHPVRELACSPWWRQRALRRRGAKPR